MPASQRKSRTHRLRHLLTRRVWVLPTRLSRASSRNPSIRHSELPLRLRVLAAPLVLGVALSPVASNPDDECAFFSLP